MKRKNLNRNALVTSIISLLLCVSMLVGTTFAWFTDEVVTGMNTIAAGNLDVELLAGGQKVNASTKLFDDVKLWEPGVVVYENLQVANVGSLALQYQMSLNFGNENDLAGHKLSEVLQVAVIDKIENATRAQVLAAAEGKGTALADFYLAGELEAGASSTEQAVVIFWAPNDNATDNLYNANNGKETSDKQPLHIEFGVKLYATQLMHEEDSFGKDYDSLAGAWDGIVDEDVPAADENGVITLTTGAELAAFAISVNEGTSYADKTVKLGADINLGNKAFTPIGACDSKTYFQGTFDGQGHTIYNLNVDKSTDTYKYTTAGLFGWIDAAGATIKNVNLENATVKGSHWVGGLVGFMTGNVENCSVINSNITGYNVNDDANGDKIGGLVGYMNSGAGKLDGNTVKGTKVTGYRDVAGLAGAVATTNTVTNNKVEDVVVTFSTANVGAIVSPKTAVVVDDTNTATNVTFVKAVTVSTETELLAALAAEDETIIINMAADIAANISTGNYYGGANTKSITINGNGNTLTLSNTYRSYFNLKNPEGKLYLNDMTLTNAHAGAHFFDYTTHFNCDVEATKVNFAKAPLIGSGYTATLTNCAYNQPSADGYGLWIMSGADVTVTGGVVNSERGFKITDEDSAAAKTTLAVSGTKFNNTEKGAILVTTAHGADVKVDNVDISNSLDTIHAVWVDEDRAENTATVTGAKVIWEANVVGSAADLTAAVAAGKTNLWLLPGEYDVGGCGGKTLTLNGTKDAVLKVMNEGEDGCDGGFDSSTVTFNGLTIDTTANNGNYRGYTRLAATFNECAFFGPYTSHRVQTFNDCEFDFNGGYFWIWGADQVNFNDCTFGGDSRNILAHGWASTVITIKDCDFAATEKGYTGAGDHTAAVEIDPAGTNTYTINFTGENTINENYAGWTRIKDSSTGHTITGLN